MRYAKYKETGIPWLPEVPEEWEMVKVGYCFDENGSGTTPSSGSTDYYDGSISWVQSGDLHGDEIFETKKTVTEKALEDYSLKIFQPPFVCMAMYGASIANVSVIRIPACTNQACCVLAKNRETTDLAYLYRCLSSASVRQTLLLKAQGGTQPNINRGDVLSTRIPLPPLPTQRAIVLFLDEKCGKVDRLVAAKEKEVALLKELKQSVIAEAVTRGVRGESGGADYDLTQRAQSSQSASSPRSLRSPRENNRRLVPSGIPWLPELPEGWEVKKVRQIARESKAKNKDNVETNVLSLSYGRIIRKKDVYSGLVPTDFATYQIVEPDYVVLRLTDLQNDHRSLRCGLVKERGIITSAYVSIVPQNILPAYLYLALHTCDLHKLFYSMGGGLRQSMNFADVANIFIPVPPLAEQREIVGYIEAKAAKIDAAAAGLEKEIAALKEYKQRLIADVVTGQRRVEGKTLSSGKALSFSGEGA